MYKLPLELHVDEKDFSIIGSFLSGSYKESGIMFSLGVFFWYNILSFSIFIFIYLLLYFYIFFYS